MKLNKIAVGLSALVMLSGAVEARGLMDFIKLPTAHEEKAYRSGTISQSEALALYSSKQKQPSFDDCADLFPAARPINMASVPAAMKAMALCSDNFAVVYSQQSNTSGSGRATRRCQAARCQGRGTDQSVLSGSSHP